MLQLRSKLGQYMKQKCPECGSELQEEKDCFGYPQLLCTGLIDPENNNVELQPCLYRTINGIHCEE